MNNMNNKMLKYKMILSYDGSGFYGLVKQPNLPTVQKSIEDFLLTKFSKKTQIVCSGRTDRYVHALNQVCTFEIDSKINKSNLKKEFNDLFEDKIKIKNLTLVNNDFHPQFSAKSKIYLYKILINPKQKEKYPKEYYYHYFSPIDYKKLVNDTTKFLGIKNFASFTGKEDQDNYERIIISIKTKITKNLLTIEIEGNGFLRYMVRNIVGVLLAHNRGKYSDEEFEDLFNDPKRGKSHYKASGGGLYLKKVIY